MSEETKQKLCDAAHVIGGTVAGCACPWYPGPSIAALIAFGVFEWWQAREVGNKGSHDFWGGVLGYFIGLGIVLVLKLTGTI